MSGKSLDLEKDGAQLASVETRVANDEADEAGAPKEITFPEGGLQGWCTVVGAFLVQFATFGYLNAFGVYQDFYVREYLTDYTPSDIGWIGGIQICLVFGAGIVTGRLFDRGYFYYLIMGGSLLHTFCFFMLSLSQKNQYYQIFLSQGLGGGLAAGITYIPSLTVPAQYFQRKRPVAIGIVSAGSALGAIIHPIMLNKLFHGHVGFHNGVRISAALNAALLFISTLLMRTRLPPKQISGGIPIRAFIRDTPYVFVVFGGFFFMGGLFLPPFYMQLDAISNGLDPQFAFYLLSILNAASFFGRIIPAIFAPKVGALNLIVFTTTATAIVIFCYGAAKTVGGFAAIAVFFGFFTGASIALTPPIVTSLAKDMSEYGARIGVTFGLAGILGLFASPILGALLTSHFHWWRAVIFGGVTMFASASSFAIARTMVSREKKTQIL